MGREGLDDRSGTVKEVIKGIKVGRGDFSGALSRSEKGA
jgi:hypothetical protein